MTDDQLLELARKRCSFVSDSLDGKFGWFCPSESEIIALCRAVRQQALEDSYHAISGVWQQMAKGTLSPQITGSAYMSGAEKMAALSLNAIHNLDATKE